MGHITHLGIKYYIRAIEDDGFRGLLPLIWVISQVHRSIN